MKCTDCGAATLELRTEEHVVTVGGRTFAGHIAADVCPACGESLVLLEELSRVELEAARALADAGLVSGESFRFMRHALGLAAKELAAALDVAHETSSRWENEERPPDRLAWATLAAMVRDRLDGHERTREQLRAMREPTPQIIARVESRMPTRSRWRLRKINYRRSTHHCRQCRFEPSGKLYA